MLGYGSWACPRRDRISPLRAAAASAETGDPSNGSTEACTPNAAATKRPSTSTATRGPAAVPPSRRCSRGWAKTAGNWSAWCRPRGGGAGYPHAAATACTSNARGAGQCRMPRPRPARHPSGSTGSQQLPATHPRITPMSGVSRTRDRARRCGRRRVATRGRARRRTRRQSASGQRSPVPEPGGWPGS